VKLTLLKSCSAASRYGLKRVDVALACRHERARRMSDRMPIVREVATTGDTSGCRGEITISAAPFLGAARPCKPEPVEARKHPGRDPRRLGMTRPAHHGWDPDPVEPDVPKPAVSNCNKISGLYVAQIIHRNLGTRFNKLAGVPDCWPHCRRAANRQFTLGAPIESATGTPPRVSCRSVKEQPCS